MRKKLNRLRADSYKFRAIANHPSHRELRKKSRHYRQAIISAKHAHWAEYLGGMMADDIWMTNKYIKEPVGDGGLPRIPTTKIRDDMGTEQCINNNEDKARAFAGEFFQPPPLQEQEVEEDPYEYPDPLPNPLPPSKEYLKRIIKRLSPYKALGPDRIPNIILQKCFAIVTDQLLNIYKAISEP